MMDINTANTVNCSSGLIKRVKNRDNKPLKSQTIIPYIPFIKYSLIVKQQFSLSTPVLFLLFLIAGNNYSGDKNTARSLCKQLYGIDNNMRNIYFKLETLIGKRLIYKGGNEYYLTDKAIDAISSIVI